MARRIVFRLAAPGEWRRHIAEGRFLTITIKAETRDLEVNVFAWIGAISLLMWVF